MQWDASETGGFTKDEPWLPLIDPQERNVEAQRGHPGSLLELYRRLLGLRPALGRFRLLDAEPGVIAYERGDHVVAVNTTSEPRSLPPGEIVLVTDDGGGLPPHASAVVRN
jgi:oligo-1,6-glucosidase/alpha-glucosidase